MTPKITILKIILASLFLPLSLMAESPYSESYQTPYGICAHVGRSELSIAQDEFKLMNAAGIKYVRTDFDWANIEKSPGEWTFSHLDELMQKAKQANMAILPILDYDVKWATPAYRHLDKWEEYVRKTVSRYQSSIPVWEVWNEQNHAGMWREKPDPANYCKLLESTYKIAKAVNPGLTVIMGGTAGIPHSYYEGLLKAGGANYLDAINFHIYCGNVPEIQVPREVAGLKKLLDKYHVDKPIWITETGWSTQTSQNENFFKILSAVLKAVDLKLQNTGIAYVDYGKHAYAGYSQWFSPEEAFAGARSIIAINYKDISSLDPRKYQVLIPTFEESFPVEYFGALKQYIKNGGTVILPYGAPLYYDLQIQPDGSVKRVQNPNKYRDELRISLQASWLNKKIPGGIKEFRVMPEYKNMIDFDWRNAQCFVRPSGLKGKDRLIKIADGINGDYSEGIVSVIRYDSDLKGNLAVVTLKGFAGGTTETKQAEYLPRMYLLAFANGIAKCFWYEFQAPEAVRNDKESHFGIVHKNLTPKPAYYAYATLIKMRPDGSTIPVIQQNGNLYTASWRRPDGKTVHAVWTMFEKQNIIAETKEGITNMCDYLGNPVAIGKKLTATPGIIYLEGPQTIQFRTVNNR